MERSLEIDLIFMLFWPIVAASITLWTGTGYLGSMLLFMAVPSFYLTYREGWQSFEKIAPFAFFLGIAGTLGLDYIGNASGVWWESTVFSFRIFEVIPVESLLWGPLAIYLPVIFFERFLDHYDYSELFPDRMKKFSKLSALLIVFLFALLAYLPVKFSFPNLYWSVCPIVILGIIGLELKEYPSRTKSLLEAGVYFFFFTAIYEFVAIETGAWHFPSGGAEFLAWISFQGKGVPLGEVVFYFGLFNIWVISTYDIVDDYINH